MTDLDAIRARDASDYAEAAMTQAMADRRALLAEVDRLTADLTYAESQLAHAAMPYPEADIDAERARIRAAVEAFPDVCSCACGYGVDRAAVLAAIDGVDWAPGSNPGADLREYIVEGFEDARRRPPLGGIEQFQDEDR